jgi:protein gp37
MTNHNSKIEWTDTTWSPVTGCTKVSPGCDHCYADGIARRFAGTPAFPRGFEMTLHPERLDAPLSWRKPRRVFVNSMSDLFHDAVPDEFIGSVFDVMARTPQHTYQILTKRHGRMRSLLNRWAAAGWTWRRSDLLWCGPLPGPLPNVWLGVSVEDQKRADLRIPALLDTPAAVRWLSCEPLLGPVDLERVGRERLAVLDPDDTGHEDGLMWHPGPAIDWVVVGGESGPGARPMHPDWARQLRDQCQAAAVPFHFKQRGAWTWTRPASWPVQDWAINPDRNLYVLPDGRSGPIAHTTFEEIGTPMYRVGKKAAGRELDGREWDEYPATTVTA